MNMTTSLTLPSNQVCTIYSSLFVDFAAKIGTHTKQCKAIIRCFQPSATCLEPSSTLRSSQVQAKGHWGLMKPTSQQDLTVEVNMSPQKHQEDINLPLINQISVAKSLETPVPVHACVCAQLKENWE